MKLTSICGAIACAALLQGCVIVPPPPPPPPAPPMAMAFGENLPPPGMREACDGQEEGAAAQLLERRGERVNGICARNPDDTLSFRSAPHQ
ncbi:hypothetical protein [Variovorax sp. PBL-E5]|uniref:hypothetical protein n=1 Tax=Variovorax sp. PBL-E5 TaxID=434014 RepID=UPI001319A621|nr:hypothetical protein [Variovorax sp. PBL-E5]VTU33189.1 hypothetical protein E5CHR_03570 [Variovorax sp. PBL-E5]